MKHTEVRHVAYHYALNITTLVFPQAGYELIYSPHIANINLWHTSGHTEFYSDDMFRPIDVDSEKFVIKPMNCPFHCLVYKVIQ